MIPTLIALCALRQDSLNWPLVPGSQFAYKGVGSNATEPAKHLSITLNPAGVNGTSVSSKTDGLSVGLPQKSAEWKTVQLAFTYTQDGTLAKFGGISIFVKQGKLWFAKKGEYSEIAPLLKDDINDVQIIKHFDSIITFVNGSRPVASLLPTAPLLPFHVGLDGWKGQIIAAAVYPRELSTDELFGNEVAVKSIAKALFADTVKATVEAELTAATPVPELERIRPYRSALLAEEYKVIRVTSGRMSSLKPGTKIRVYRYGIRSGEKTSVKDAKVGDRAEMLIQGYDTDPKFSREFQVYGLDPDITIPLYVDVTPVK